MLVAADLAASSRDRPTARDRSISWACQFTATAENKNPVKVCQAGVEKAKAEGARVVVLDTAGRLAIDEELMAELQRIDKKVGPDQVYLGRRRHDGARRRQQRGCLQ